MTHDPLGNPVDRRHPWNQHTNPKPQKRDLDDKYSWVMSPRWYDGNEHLALDTGGGPLARLWSTALAGLVDIGYVKATGTSVQINLPKTALKGPVSLEWKIPQWSNTIERNRARTYFQAYAAACALHFAEKALAEIRAGRTKTWEKFEVPDEAIGCGFTEAVRGVLSHHMVIRDGKIANYHPYPPTPWNANPRDVYGTPGPYEDAVQDQPLFEENDREHFKGIDIMRTVRSFDPCLPCGVHMYLGERQDDREAALADDGRVAASERGPGVSDPRAAGERIEQLLDALGTGGPGGPGPRRGAGPGRRRALRRRAGAGARDRRRRRRADRRDCRGAGRRRAGLRAAGGARPAPVRRSCERVERALDSVRPYLRSHGGDVELLGVDDEGVVGLRLLGHCDGCAGSTATLQSAVEGAIEAAAPEVVRIDVEEPTAAPHPAPTAPLIPVDSLTVRTRA